MVQVVRHMHKHKDEFRSFLGEDWDRYMQARSSCAAAACVPLCAVSARCSMCAASQSGPDLQFCRLCLSP